ncbi:hypothetical protein V3F56_10425 [Moorellaceae bacterium AZ2]
MVHVRDDWLREAKRIVGRRHYLGGVPAGILAFVGLPETNKTNKIFVTFLLPPGYRMIFAAILSIVIGTILSYASRKGKAAAGPLASGGVCR